MNDDRLITALRATDADWFPEPPSVLPTQGPPTPRASRATILTTVVVVLLLAGAAVVVVVSRSSRHRAAVLDQPTGARPCNVDDAKLVITPHTQATAPRVSYEVNLIALSSTPCRVWDEDAQTVVTGPGSMRPSGDATCAAHNEHRVGPGGVSPPVFAPRHPCLPGDPGIPLTVRSPAHTEPDYGRVLCTCGTYTDPAPHSEVVLADRAAKQGGPWPVFRSIGDGGGLAVPGGDPLGTYRITATDGPWTAQPATVVLMSLTGRTSGHLPGGALTLTLSPTTGPVGTLVTVRGTVSDPATCPVADVRLAADAATGAASGIYDTAVAPHGTYTLTYRAPDTTLSGRGTHQVLRMTCERKDHHALDSETATTGFDLQPP